MRRSLPGGIELDDDPGRIDVDAVHDFLANHSYWARGRARQQVVQTVEEAARVIGLYHEQTQIGFARVVSDGVQIAYLADVYVLPDYRGGGLGTELVREAVDGGPQAPLRWLLGTDDAHGLYAKFGFAPAGERYMSRPGRGGPGTR